MEKKRFKLPTFVLLILRKNNNVLLMQRHGTGFDDNYYSCPGGGIDGDEPITQAITREADEELGITLNKEKLKLIHTLHVNGRYGEYISFFLETTEWSGKPQIKEPDKCSKLEWFNLDSLPKKILPESKHVIKSLEENITYSELGWGNQQELVLPKF